MRGFLRRLWREEDGQDLVEYGLLVALVALAATAGMNSLATAVDSEFSNVGARLSGAAGGGGGNGGNGGFFT